jgi:chromosome condensin MukBEF complex kleisin-like MukF subunit
MPHRALLILKKKNFTMNFPIERSLFLVYTLVYNKETVSQQRAETQKAHLLANLTQELTHHDNTQRLHSDAAEKKRNELWGLVPIDGSAIGPTHKNL